MAMGIGYGRTNMSFFGIEVEIQGSQVDLLRPSNVLSSGTIRFDHIQSRLGDEDGDWLLPFEDNLLETKIEIMEDIAYHGDLDEYEDDPHLDLCRQLAGGN